MTPTPASITIPLLADAALPLAAVAVLALVLALLLAARGFLLLVDQLRSIATRLDQLTNRLDSLPTTPPLPVLTSPIEAPAPQPKLTIDELHARLDAARQVGDTESVLALHDQLSPQLDPTQRTALDSKILPWFLDLLMRRMRSGTVRVDVALLAARIADRFPTTREGASLRASLPTLRRSAGLCAECAEPYRGDDDACPECTLRKAEAGPSTLPIPGPWPEDEPIEPDPAAANPQFDD